MHVLQWLFKVSQDEKSTKYDRIEEDKPFNKEDEKSKDVVCQKPKSVVKKAQKPEETSIDCRDFRYLAILLRSSGMSRAYFYDKLNRKTINSLKHRQQQYYIRSMKTKEDHLVGNNKKGLPIADSITTTTTSSSPIKGYVNDNRKQFGSSDREKGRLKGDQDNNKTSNMSKMKELLRWADASKNAKGGKFGRKSLYLRSRSTTIKSRGFDEELSDDSPNISVRRGIESRSNTCSDYDLCSEKTGHWITTDDEFVVLEL